MYNKDYLDDSDWKYYHSIAVDASTIWHKGGFKSVGEEKYFYDLMLDSIMEKKKIEEMYNF